MAKRKSGLNVHGIILLDKRLGVSSNRALQEVRRLFNANKAGHTGSLDPLATGLLPLCFGEATKVSALMLDDDKRYQVVVQLGVMTDTGDAEGEVIQVKPVPVLSQAEVLSCLQQFTGEIDQVPPMYSALKQNGKKLYELAREGVVVDRKARRITIYALELLKFDDAQAVTPNQLTLDVSCSKGTYIRSLAEDIGNALGCGGTVTQLRRVVAGQFTIQQAKTIEQLTAMSEQELQDALIRVDEPLEHIPLVSLTSQQAIAINYGQSIEFKLSDDIGSINTPALIRMYQDDIFLGLGEMGLDGRIAPKKLFNMTIA